MHRSLPLLPLFLALLAPVLGSANPESPRVLAEGWRFLRGHAPAEAVRADYDDSAWRALRLPHDWAIEGPFEAEGDGGTGRLPWRGEGWYRLRFTAPEAPSETRLYFDFDGVMAFPRVFLNGELVGEWDYGYTSFRVDATSAVRWGEENVLAVHVDTRRWGSRWYPGAGIYRKVTMQVSGPVHLAHWGVQVRTNGDELTGQRPDTANIRAEVENHRDRAVDATVELEVLDPEGRTVAASRGSLNLAAGAAGTSEQALLVRDPLLWDVDHPHLYTLHTRLRVDGETVETRTTRFGFRTFAFTADDGFHLNGRRVQLYGVNNHHDLGPLGGAFNRRAAQRQLEIMREMGVNSLRTAHNPPAPEVLELCDEMGILVWNEVFDKYTWTAGRADLTPPLPEFSRRHIAATIRRDFNHPSIVVWSTGNEVNPDGEGEGITPERVRMMADFVRELDLTRPVAQGCHIPSLVDGKNFAALDLTGWNYARRYTNYRATYPDRPIIYSESASALSTRGYYDPAFPNRPSDYDPSSQLSSYDLTAAPWSDIPEVEFRLMEEDAYVAGEFVWTGFDYLGEPTPYDQTARSSYFGIVDLCGFPKDRFYLYRSHWRPDVPTVHLLPHWNWPDRLGENVPVFVYTNGDAAELFLNGRSLGMRRKGETPPRLPDLAREASVRASSSAPGHAPDAILDHELDSLWRPAEGDDSPAIELDLGQVRTIAQIVLDTVNKENDYAYVIEGSLDGRAWKPLVDHPRRFEPQWAGPTRAFHELDPVEVRHLRLRFLETQRNAPYGLRAFQAYAGPIENDYFDITYDYRLRWNTVPYEPGELRAVAYAKGEPIGEAVVETTGAPARLRLTPDRVEVAADGEDLVFFTVEALDRAGRPHPLAHDLVLFTVEGPASIAAVGNGNPLSFEPFVSDRRHLFFGKALLIVRPASGDGGAIVVRATAPGLAAAETTVQSRAD
jgi:hypothetical protein